MMMMVTIPEGAAPGQQLQIQAPSGQQIQFTVPPGAASGTQVQVPVTSPAAGVPSAAVTGRPTYAFEAAPNLKAQQQQQQQQQTILADKRPSARTATTRGQKAKGVCIALLNPRLKLFNRPFFLAVVIGLCTLAVSIQLFFWQYNKELCTAINFPKPAKDVTIREYQLIGGFNEQNAFVQKLRFGGETCRYPEDVSWEEFIRQWGNTENTHRECTFYGSEVAGDVGSLESRDLHLFNTRRDAKLFLVKDVTTETLIDTQSAGVDVDTTIRIVNEKQVRRAVCLQDAKGFISTTEGRAPGGGYYPGQTSPGFVEKANLLHNHPQLGSWRCNPPKVFYTLKEYDMAGDSPHHFAQWHESDVSRYPNNWLPLCSGQDPWTDDYPFYDCGQQCRDEGWEHTCGTVGYMGGNDLPVLMTYQVIEETTYEKSWAPQKICKKQLFGTALGVAMAYTGYVEIMFTALFVLMCYYCCGIIKPMDAEGLQLGKVLAAADGGGNVASVEAELSALKAQVHQMMVANSAGDLQQRRPFEGRVQP